MVAGDAQRADVALLGLGAMLHPALAAAQKLEAHGLRTVVVDPRFVKPLDEALILGLARQVGRLVVAEEAMLAGGFGSAVLELFEREGVTAKVRRLGMVDEHLEHGDAVKQRAKLGLDAAGIERAALALCEGRTVVKTAG